MSKLYSAFTHGSQHFTNRFVMPPMTRCRSSQPGNVPTEEMAEYYAQRTSAALIIAEATQVSADAQGYSYTPGVHSEAQIEGWRKVTDAVHEKGGKIFLQVWHTGRMSHKVFHDGNPPVAPSSIPTPEGVGVWIADESGKGGKEHLCTPPRALSLNEIKSVQDDFVQAAINAKEAGFDGIELHGGNGYLIDQFLRKSANQRQDEYGGSPDNRIRFLTEILQRISTVFEPDNICVRFAPHNQARGMDDPDTPETVLLAMAKMAEMNIGYVHFAEVEWDAEPDVPEEFRALARVIFPNLIIVAGNYDQQKADWVLDNHYADLVAFGRPYIANPDLPYRMANHIALNDVKQDALYGGGAEGYLDYPTVK